MHTWKNHVLQEQNKDEVVMMTGMPPAAQLQREDLNVACTMHEPPTSTMSNIFTLIISVVQYYSMCFHAQYN